MLPAFRASNPLPSSPGVEERPPFILESRSLDLQNDGTFTPEAAVLLTPTLLESRLLLDLTPTELQTLLMVLCCVTGNGGFVATSESLALRLHLWPGQMRARLERLMTRSFGGEPLLRSQSTESGLRLFAPSPALFETRHVLVFPAPDGRAPLERPAALQQDGSRIVGGLREEVIEHSRATYGRPRAEVEAEINRFLGSERNPAMSWPGPAVPKSDSGVSGAELTEIKNTEPLTPEEISKRDMGRKLIAAGLGSDQARFLVDAFPLQLIERQLGYLPFRHARNPAGMLVASIEGDYAPPLAMRHAALQPEIPSAPSPGVEENAEDEGASNMPESPSLNDLPPLQVDGIATGPHNTGSADDALSDSNA